MERNLRDLISYKFLQVLCQDVITGCARLKTLMGPRLYPRDLALTAGSAVGQQGGCPKVPVRDHMDPKGKIPWVSGSVYCYLRDMAVAARAASVSHFSTVFPRFYPHQRLQSKNDVAIILFLLQYHNSTPAYRKPTFRRFAIAHAVFRAGSSGDRPHPISSRICVLFENKFVSI